MPTALLCEHQDGDLEVQLRNTVLCRADFRRSRCVRLDAARELLRKAIDVVIIDGDLSWGPLLVRLMRRDSATRDVATVVAFRGADPPRERELTASGAHAVLRLPAGQEWDGCLARLLPLAARHEVRVPVRFRVATTIAATAQAMQGSALDVSETGMLLESPDLEVGSELHLAFQLPGGSGLVAARGRVVRRTDSARFGIEFMDRDDDFLEQIRGLAASVSGE